MRGSKTGATLSEIQRFCGEDSVTVWNGDGDMFRSRGNEGRVTNEGPP